MVSEEIFLSEIVMRAAFCFCQQMEGHYASDYNDKRGKFWMPPVSVEYVLSVVRRAASSLLGREGLFFAQKSENSAERVTKFPSRE